MKILINSYNQTLRGLIPVLQQIGADIFIYQNGTRAAFDLFHEIKPDVLITTPQNINRELYKCIEKYSPKLVVINDTTINDFFMDLSQKNKINSLVSGNYADILNYAGSSIRPELETDLLIMTDWYPREALVSIIKNAFDYNIKFKMFGSTFVAHPYYLGSLSIDEEKDVIASAKRTLCISGSSNEMNVWVAGGGAVSSLIDKPVRKKLSELNTTLHLSIEILKDLDYKKEMEQCQNLLQSIVKT